MPTISPLVSLSPLLAPVLLEALGPRRPRAARRLVVASVLVGASSLGGLALLGPVAALVAGGSVAVATHARVPGVGLVQAIFEVPMVSLFATTLFLAAHIVVSSPALSLTTVVSAVGLVGIFLAKGGWFALSRIGR